MLTALPLSLPALRTLSLSSVCRWQTVCASGYVEDVTFSNAKLLLGSVAVAIAAACNLLPAPYATSAVLLRSSVLAYFALQALLQLMHFALPRHCILITRPRRHIPPDAAAPAAALDPVKRKALLKSSKPSSLAYTSPPLVLTSQLPRYATAYALALGRKEGGPVRVERVMEITEFFDRTGVFLKAKYEAEVQLLIQEVERRETNSRKAAREPSGLKTQ